MNLQKISRNDITSSHRFSIKIGSSTKAYLGATTILILVEKESTRSRNATVFQFQIISTNRHKTRVSNYSVYYALTFRFHYSIRYILCRLHPLHPHIMSYYYGDNPSHLFQLRQKKLFKSIVTTYTISRARAII